MNNNINRKNKTPQYSDMTELVSGCSNMQHTKTAKLLLYLAFFSITISSCTKLVEVKPPITQTTGESVYTLDANAAAVLTGLYSKLSTGSISFATGRYSISLLSGLSADEFTLNQSISNTENLYYYYTNALFTNPTGNPGTEHWGTFFRNIYTCNEAIEGLGKSSSLTAVVKQQLLGEAKFMRAFFYFYLVNLYGGVPLALTTDYEINSKLPRASVSDVYQQIINDLKDAQNLLGDSYVASDAKTSTSERLRPNKWAATALLARAYLYGGKLMDAETQATAVIGNTAKYDTVSLNNVFLKNSKEAIWQLQPVNSGWNTEDAKVFVINDVPSNSKPIAISSSLYNSFEAGDNRKTNWIKDTTIGSVLMPYPFKYKKAKSNDPVTEYLMVLRLGELYLIRAEARARQNKIGEAQSDLNVIRKRAGLVNTTANDETSLLTAILKERRVEFFSEWGNRWFDLKRTGNIDAVMTIACTQKGGTWKSEQQLYPILYTEIQKDQNLSQNEGY